MRLSWPFGRQQQQAPAPDPAGVFTARPRGAQAWRDLPVLATSVGNPPLIAPTPPFRADLAGAAPAPIALAPLTHGRGLDAPTGLARNLVTALAPVSAASSSDRDAARSAQMPTRKRPRAEQLAQLEEATDAAPLQSSTAAPVPAVASVSVPETRARRAPAIAASTVAPASLVRADRQPALPPMPVGRVGPARSATAAQRAPATASPTKEAVAAPAAKPLIQPDPAPPTPASDGRLTLGQSRRRGLGAPIDPTVLNVTKLQPAPDSAPADLTPSMSLVRNTNSPVSVRAADVRPQSSTSPSSEAPAMSPRAESSGAHASTSVPKVQSASSAAATTLAAPLRQRLSRSAAVAQPSRPLVGARPMQAHVQRAPIVTPAAEKSNAASTKNSAGGSEPVRIHRGSEAANMAGALDARAFTHGGEIYLPDSHGALTGQKAQSLLAHEMTHVSQQRKLGSSLPHEDSAVGRELEAQAVAAESSHELPLAVPSEKAASRAAVATTPARVSPQLGLPDSSAQASAPDHAQRASANDAKWKDPDDAFRAQLDSNEDYMFDRFERRLRYLLIHERERGGTLIDAL